jgi:hypothetical protein
LSLCKGLAVQRRGKGTRREKGAEPAGTQGLGIDAQGIGDASEASGGGRDRARETRRRRTSAEERAATKSTTRTLSQRLVGRSRDERATTSATLSAATTMPARLWLCMPKGGRTDRRGSRRNKQHCAAFRLDAFVRWISHKMTVFLGYNNVARAGLLR